MAIVTSITKVIEIPHEPGETALICKLSHVQLKAAQKARQSEGVGFMKELGGELMAALRTGDNEKLKTIQETQEADINNYDRSVLLKSGIVSWSYRATLPEGTDDQDEVTAKFLAQAIFNFSRPETAGEAKNV